ncbi:polyprenyl synthetase family protein [Amycolatopsis alba]|uniref:polyprenyl synthetase family protein n=1 Tax=Amycolatopsis alba TaxID=76020 RepID=UPI0003709EE6|nr:polyprenyl synthetase family protein [Amycolatopsis alba]
MNLVECQEMAAGKTAALLNAACGLGALLGGGTPAQVQCLHQSGEHLGMAFQLVDDLLGIWADPAVTGKPVGADLAVRRKSLPVVAALDSATDAGEELAALYRLDRPLSAKEIARATDLVEQAGGRSWAQQRAEYHLDQALRSLRQADPAPVGATALSTLAGTLAHRVR